MGKAWQTLVIVNQTLTSFIIPRQHKKKYKINTAVYYTDMPSRVHPVGGHTQMYARIVPAVARSSL